MATNYANLFSSFALELSYHLFLISSSVNQKYLRSLPYSNELINPYRHLFRFPIQIEINCVQSLMPYSQYSISYSLNSCLFKIGTKGS
jgi:hypothetical protein